MLGRECGMERWSRPVLGELSTPQAQGSAAEWAAGRPPGVQQRRQVHKQLQAVVWRRDLCGSWRVSQSFPSWWRLQDEGIFQERGTSNMESSRSKD